MLGNRQPDDSGGERIIVAKGRAWWNMTAMRESYSLLLDKDYFKFSCAHFLIFPDGAKERLHGHNYHVVCLLDASLVERTGLVLDFLEIKPVIRALCDVLDERMLLPSEHPGLSYAPSVDGHIDWSYADCHYRAPEDEVLVLPINNTSVENLSRWFAHELWRRLLASFPSLDLNRLEVTVSETPGQAAVYRIERDSN